MLNQRLSQKMLQKLSPQQIQLMKLLQVPTVSLEQRIKEELEVNPALEEGDSEVDDYYEDEGEEFSSADELDESDKMEDSKEDDVDITEYLSEDHDYDHRSDNNDDYNDEEKKTMPVAVQNSFHDFLDEQLNMLALDEHTFLIAEHLVGSLDEDGYLRRELDAIVDDLSFGQHIETTEKELEQVLKIIQKFDPSGVGARNLQECLLLQLLRVENQDKTVQLAIKIIQQYFDAFTKKHYDKLLKSLGVNEKELKEAIDEILRLNPKPGGALEVSAINLQSIIPDFTIVQSGTKLEVLLNSRNAPDLRISDSFKEMLVAYNRNTGKDKKQKEAVVFIKQKIDSAKWFIDAIKQRQNTLLVTMDSILHHQYDYFLTGDETKLRPMILKDIAEKTGLDISTISRVANSKYVQTEFGTFGLKSFFSESLQTEGGEEVSTREVKKILNDFISAEEKVKPLSDEALTDMLKEKGYFIARRTVAKYREQLNIPVARLRKEL